MAPPPTGQSAAGRCGELARRALLPPCHREVGEERNGVRRTTKVPTSKVPAGLRALRGLGRMIVARLAGRGWRFAIVSTLACRGRGPASAGRARPDGRGWRNAAPDARPALGKYIMGRARKWDSVTTEKYRENETLSRYQFRICYQSGGARSGSGYRDRRRCTDRRSRGRSRTEASSRVKSGEESSGSCIEYLSVPPDPHRYSCHRDGC